MISENILKTIHQRIHHPFKGQEIQPAKNGLRSIKAMGITFIEQNQKKNSKFAALAKEPGHYITWGIRDGSWIYVHEKPDGKFEINQ